MTLSLAQALRARSSRYIAFIGAGGKTTAMFQLARQLPPPVIVTATSHLGTWQTGWANRHMIASPSKLQEELTRELGGVVLLTGEVEGDRTRPISGDLLDWLKQYCKSHSVPLLIEADGAREKPLKAWAEHEPPIPPFVDLVIQVAGLTGIGKPLDSQYIHRPEIFSKLSQVKMDEIISPAALVHVLMHTESALRNIPNHARRIVLLNQADTPELQSLARGLAGALIPPYDGVVIASLRQEKILAVHEPIAGIILAAGGSTRYGQPKQLLDWKGVPFVRAVAKTALQARLSPVVVVTGASAEQIEQAIVDLNVTVTKNEEWKDGQASSIRAGIKALVQPPPGIPQIRQGITSVNNKSSHTVFGEGAREAEGVGGAIFLLADQPQLTASVLGALVEKHAEGLYPVLVPLVMDQRANPVLFDRVTFPDLLTLEGDVGGRAIFHKHRLEYLPWHDDRLLLDVDTPEMYQRLISDESL